ncbi:MAG: hypothetical protein HFH61_06640 [Lachnospiraceae bacterium]|nr:hypothetical protein [Lachnospiraceae bacterium]
MNDYTFREVSQGDFNNACTDVGDLTHLMPVVNFTYAGFRGGLHGEDFAITDWDKAVVAPAKLMALTVYYLLKDQAAQARQAMENFQPAFTREGYVDFVQKIIGDR